jgi:hypothetical protein
MRIDSSGNVGIGRSTMDARLMVQTSHSSTDVTAASSNSTVSIGNTAAGNGVYNAIEFAANQQNMYIMSFNNNQQASRRIGFFLGSVAGDAVDDERLSILGNGNVGIGISSPDARLDVRETATSAVPLRIETNGGSANTVRPQISMFSGGSGGYHISTIRSNLSNDPYGLVFTENTTERMRIDSAGNLLLNKTASQAAGDGFFVNSDGTFAFTRSVTTTGPLGYLYNEGSTASGFRFLSFRLGSFTEVGTITTNGSSTVSYNTSSDYRLKENVEYDFDASTRLKQLKPARFNFIADADTTVDGFLAHEVQDIIPEAISGTKDAVENIGTITDQDNNVIEENATEPSELPEGQTWTQTGTQPVYQGIDQSKLVPLLVKSLQEALTEIDSLKARLDDAGL